MNLDTIICPGCGWIGTINEVMSTAYNACPSCGYENNSYDGADRLLTIGEMFESDVDYNDVRFDLFLKSFMQVIEVWRKDNENE